MNTSFKERVNGVWQHVLNVIDFVFGDHNMSENDGFFDELNQRAERSDNDSIITHPTYDDIHKACELLANKIKEANHHPDRVVGLSRGGLLPAVILSHMLDVPMVCVDYSSKDGEGDNKDHVNELPMIEGKDLLIVDDICDSGKTLAEVFKAYTLRKQLVTTVVLYYKENPTGFMPDIYWHLIPNDSDWIVFPFEQ